MHTLQTLRTFKTRNFTLVVKAVEDCDLDLSYDESGQDRQGLESGALVAFGVIVTLYCRGNEVGSDSLWNCIYKSYDDFLDHYGTRPRTRQFQAKENRKARREKREPHIVCCGSYFSDMVHGAVAEARKTMADFANIRLRPNA